MKYIAAVLLLVAAISAQNVPSTNKGRHLDIPAISREANGSVVSIIMSDKEGHPIAQGSGFLISKNGRVVTNYHVIKTGSSAMIKLPDGAFFPVDGVIASDKDRDVAIIKAHGNGFRTLTLGDSARLQVGEEVVAIGNPLSLESTVSNGIVSAIRTVEDEGGKFLQITAPISPGSSGGPLFNMAGEVVGITTSYVKSGENLNFAIPINDVKPILSSLVSDVRSLPDESENNQNHGPQAPDRSVSPTVVGLYQSEPDLDSAGEKSCTYVRFYADGTVIEVFSVWLETPTEIANLTKWFHKPYTSFGTYKVLGSEIEFAIKSPEGTVDYRGEIQGTTLRLDISSHINGHRSYRTYHLIQAGDDKSDQAEDGHGSTQSSTAGQPDLNDTLSFMSKSVLPEKTYISAESKNQGCDLEIVRNQHYKFAVPSGVYVKSTDAYGVEHHGFKYTIAQDSPPSNFMWISLSEIDPESIKSYGAFSPEFIAREHPDENKDALKNPDLTVVIFATTNQEKTIKEGNTLSSSGTIVFSEVGTYSVGMLAFQSKDGAERFVTAFVHAVNLCGGKLSDFAPTPRE